jgi:hypothetical protein
VRCAKHSDPVLLFDPVHASEGNQHKLLDGEGALESHTDAATRSLAVWGWLSNARQKFIHSGKNIKEASNAINNYESLYNKLSQHMCFYIEYLLKWFF